MKSNYYKAKIRNSHGYNIVESSESDLPVNYSIGINLLNICISMSCFDNDSVWSYHFYENTPRINEYTFRTVVEKKLFWPTECVYSQYTNIMATRSKTEQRLEHGWDFLGCILVRNEQAIDVLTYVYGKTNCPYLLIPIGSFYGDDNSNKNRHYMKCYNIFPNRTVKCFTDKNRWNTYMAKLSVDRETNREKRLQSIKKIANTIADFSLVSPSFSIVEITKPTQWINVKVGDIIRGEMKVIENGKPQLHGVSASRTNQVHVYVNDKFERTLSPLTFQDLFVYNFITEEVIGK